MSSFLLCPTSNVPFRFHLAAAYCYIPGPTRVLYTFTLLDLHHQLPALSTGHKVICEHIPWRFPSDLLCLLISVANKKEHRSDSWRSSTLTMTSHLQPSHLGLNHPNMLLSLSVLPHPVLQFRSQYFTFSKSTSHNAAPSDPHFCFFSQHRNSL